MRYTIFGLVIASGFWLELAVGAERFRVCDGVYTNLECREQEARLQEDRNGNFPGTGTEEQVLTRSDDKLKDPDKASERQKWADELPRARVLNRFESSRVLLEMEPERRRMESSDAHPGNNSIKSKIRGNRSEERLRGKQRLISPEMLKGDLKPDKNKFVLIKLLEEQQRECNLPECLPALELEEAVERCKDLDVNYDSCREKTVGVLGKVAKVKEQQRRVRYEEGRHRLELEKLRQREQKLKTDRVRRLSEVWRDGVAAGSAGESRR